MKDAKIYMYSLNLCIMLAYFVYMCIMLAYFVYMCIMSAYFVYRSTYQTDPELPRRPCDQPNNTDNKAGLNRFKSGSSNITSHLFYCWVMSLRKCRHM